MLNDFLSIFCGSGIATQETTERRLANVLKEVLRHFCNGPAGNSSTPGPLSRIMDLARAYACWGLGFRVLGLGFRV